ncbi:class I SAM-dependent methyltransferase [Sphingomicrobium arenosum]|uniref:class I SAM-dependent methyltransferase n=1 Tax=Sphingomicrobium arenosum TaxID=2233861 RepID=UPI002240F8C8|nr:class I SAM-dependent methyltransferase [Sphingomicrobium arenosum]
MTAPSAATADMAPDAIRAAEGSADDVAFQRNLYTDPNATRRQLHWDRRHFVMDRVEKYSAPGDRLLEIGVGCGIFTEEMAGLGRQVDAVDIHPAYLANVEGKPGIAVHKKDATQELGLGPHKLAICSEVLEHVPPSGSQGLLDAVFDSLEPGGHFILTTPQRWATVELMARLFKFPAVLWLARKIYGHAEELGHINLLTAGQLRAQIDRAGFEVVDQKRFGFYLPLIAEAGGKPGAKLLKALDKALAKLPVLRGLLWTQGYVLRKPA